MCNMFSFRPAKKEQKVEQPLTPAELYALKAGSEIDHPKCPQCGSTRTLYRGFEGCNQRIFCYDCREETYV